MKNDLILRITDYLAKGGLFNPEAMEHEKVQRLLMDIRDYLLDEADKTPNKYPNIPPFTPIPYPYTTTNSTCPKCGIKLDSVMGYVCSTPQCPTGLGGTRC